MKGNMVGWFEIPVLDMEGAIGFYNAVFSIAIQPQNFEGVEMAWFPFEEGGTGASGTLIKHELYEPSAKPGVLIYFMSEDVQIELDKVENSGGQVLMPKTQISPEVGYYGLFLDSEGNRIALHSRH